MLAECGKHAVYMHLACYVMHCNGACASYTNTMVAIVMHAFLHRLQALCAAKYPLAPAFGAVESKA
jgi:hypothetical protein